MLASTGTPQPVLLRPAPASSPWSASAWLFLREGGGGQLATGGQLGGAQAGARVTWRIDDARRLAVFGRVSGPLRQRGFEAAAGIEWRPLGELPVRLAVERRIALERGGRDAFAAYAFGGVDAIRLGGLRLDAYGQAGAVGARSRDLFADGSVRIGRELALSGRTGVTLGAGAWGAAQPGVARLDVGPQAVVRFPAGDLGLALAIDWRLRVAGQARPGSGPTVTLGVDF